MAEQPYNPDEQALFEREFEQRLREELPHLREEEIRAAAQRAAARELELRRELLREQLESEVEETAAEDPETMREEANREAPSKLLIGIILLILLLFLLAALGRLPTFGSGEAMPALAGSPLQPQFASPEATLTARDRLSEDAPIGRANPDAGTNVAFGEERAASPPIGAMFQPFYDYNGALRIFGYPLSPVIEVRGRQVQWFERARMEYWPENPEPYTVQLGLVGREYTDYRDFPDAQFFPSTADHWFFPETSQSVEGEFLRFWQANGGLRIFGYPISERLVEIEPGSRRWKTVQYFERARFELNTLVPPDHPERIQLGLLGRALYLNEEKAQILAAPQPTPMPLP